MKQIQKYALRVARLPYCCGLGSALRQSQIVRGDSTVGHETRPIDWLKGGIVWHNELMLRIKSQSGFSLIELVTTMAIVSILAAVAATQLVGTRSNADMSESLGELDRQSSAISQWASAQEFVDGSRLSTLDVQSAASAVEGKALDANSASRIIATTSTANAIPNPAQISDGITLLYKGTALDGEWIRLTRCQEYFDTGDKLCGRTDIFPWGNSQQNAPNLLYRSLECSGTCQLANKLWSVAGCLRWPSLPPVNRELGNNVADNECHPTATEITAG